MDFNIAEIEAEINNFKEEGKKLFMTSSFQTHSIPLLHIIHNIDNTIPIFFLDTGYHFNETIRFKNHLKNEYGFNVTDLRSEVSRINQKDQYGNLMYTSDPDYCCFMNKVLPLEPILREYDVWISGVRRSQTAHREKLARVIEGKYNTKHYHPILEWDSKQIFDYRKKYTLPEHPLEEFGYFSVGCVPCTRKLEINGNGSERDTRWFGLNKNECGLHTETL